MMNDETKYTGDEVKLIKDLIIDGVEKIENDDFLYFLLSLILHREKNKQEWDG